MDIWIMEIIILRLYKQQQRRSVVIMSCLFVKLFHEIRYAVIGVVIESVFIGALHENGKNIALQLVGNVNLFVFKKTYLEKSVKGFLSDCYAMTWPHKLYFCTSVPDVITYGSQRVAQLVHDCLIIPGARSKYIIIKNINVPLACGFQITARCSYIFPKGFCNQLVNEKMFVSAAEILCAAEEKECLEKII